jgi:hypothetical protein
MDQPHSQQIPLEELVDGLAGIRKLAFKVCIRRNEFSNGDTFLT